MWNRREGFVLGFNGMPYSRLSIFMCILLSWELRLDFVMYFTHMGASFSLGFLKYKHIVILLLKFNKDQSV